MADWFSSLASTALKFADDLADSLVSQANEAQQTMQEEQQKLKSEEELKKQILQTHQLLPWETMVEARQILSKALMENILALSTNENNFTCTAANSTEVLFSIHDFAPSAMKMIELDSNLARMHAKLSPKMNEEEFWFNYYCRIVFLRACSGIEGLDAQKAAEKWAKEDIITPMSVEVPSLSVRAVHSPVGIVDTPTPIKPLSTSSLLQSPSPHASSPSLAGGAKGDASSLKSMPTPKHDDLDLEGLEDLNLDDLGDLDMLNDDMLGEDFENIGSSECNDEELEAQIARELEEM